MEDGRGADPVRVLLVDDATDYRALVGHILHGTGRYVVAGEAGNGRDAIDAARTLAPDLVLLDLSMPVMSGLDALPRIREAAPDSTVVVVSGFCGGPDAGTARRLGAAGCLEKGASIDELLAALDRVAGVTSADLAERPDGREE